ncbi:MAG: DUF2189 domain-containing protein [Rhizobiaceae bacterium]
MSAYHIIADAHGNVQHPDIRRIRFSQIGKALRLGFDDFWQKPSHYVFLCLIYPIAGVVLVAWSSGANLLPLVYPLVTGFALVGPVAAIGLYEISRRRELGLDTSWRHALEVRKSPALPSIIALGAMLVGLFIAWLVTAYLLYAYLFGDAAPASVGAFLDGVFNTPEGLQLAVAGTSIGFVFALTVLATTVISFPLLLDRDVGAISAVETSVRVALANPFPVLAWGLIVAFLLFIGTLPVFAGLAIVLPWLGHSTWHLYRMTVVSDQAD